MGRSLAFEGPRQVGFVPDEGKPLGPDDVRLKTLYSGISAGTELTFYRGSNPYLHKQWDASRRLFVPQDAVSLEFPVLNVGYEEVGEIVETGASVTGIPVGTRVFGVWGHRTHHVAPAEYVRPRMLPDGLDPILGIFSRIGAIALNGVHDGRIRIGETVAVFGLGVLGQIVAQAAQQSGARVIGVDLHDSRLTMAKDFRINTTLNPARDNVAEAIKDLTGGRGADVCFEVTGVSAALGEAIRAAAYSARVVAMGFFQGEASGLFLGEEFHHNRVNVVCSQISGTDPELTYRWDRLRMEQTTMRLQADGLLNLRPLITHVAAFEDAASLFEALDKTPEDVMQAVIDFQSEG